MITAQYERTPLHLAAAGNHVMTAQLLLGAGASVDARDEVSEALQQDSQHTCRL